MKVTTVQTTEPYVSAIRALADAIANLNAPAPAVDDDLRHDLAASVRESETIGEVLESAPFRRLQQAWVTEASARADAAESEVRKLREAAKADARAARYYAARFQRLAHKVSEFASEWEDIGDVDPQDLRRLVDEAARPYGSSDSEPLDD